MQPTPIGDRTGDEIDPEIDHDAQPRPGHRVRLIVLLVVLVCLLLLATLPPLVNVSRFRQRIAANISSALGRPVHFDSLSLTLLPLPGFTLKTFVIDEDPAFGYEPILRAGEVQVTLRIGSLLRPHVEFSKIAFSEPSVNLVHLSDGRWNIEGLLLQASHLDAAPTGQRFAGPARRFPYIEATGARLNLKLDQEKSPVSLSDADFALWLPEPHQWHLRLEAHPMRTDTAPGDTGTLRAEGTLGGAIANPVSLDQVPIDLHGDWRDAQLGGLSRLVLGRDPGLRGDFSLSFSLTGTVARNTIATNIQLVKARRADFVPNHLLALELSCKAFAGDTFHSFTSIACQWPPAGSSGPTLLAVTAGVPDARQLRSASATLSLPGLPADTLFDWLSVATPHPPTVLEGAGKLSGTLHWGASPSAPAAQPALTGQLELSGASLRAGEDSDPPLLLGDALLRSTRADEAPPPHTHMRPAALRSVVEPTLQPNSFDLLPVSLPLGGKQPATLDGHFDAAGYSLHLAGNVLPSRLAELAKAVPQFGDGLLAYLDTLHPPAATSQTAPAAPSDSAEAVSASATEALVHVDLTATRAWGGPQHWQETASPVPAHTSRH